MSFSSAVDRIWMPFTWYRDLGEHPPIVISRGEGIYVFDADGRRIIDAVGSWWVSNFGHCHPRIAAAVRRQVDTLEHILMAGYLAAPTIRLSQLLGELLPPRLRRIFFSDDGSTSVEVALKIALQYHALRNSGRCEFVGLGGGYHGDTLGAMSVSSIPHYHTLFHDRFKKHHATDAPYCYRCPVGKEPVTCKAECMDSLERLFIDHGDNIAACIFEPMLQGAAGMRIYPVKVLQRIFSLCTSYKILTIADEVATGFGRTGKLFACEHVGETPDIMCLAKGLTGGFAPMGITVVQEHIFEEFKGGFGSERILYHGHSFTGNPLAASAACASMELIKELAIPASFAPLIEYFNRGLHDFWKYDRVGDIRSIGLIGAIELVQDRNTKEPFPVSDRVAFRVAEAALSHGLLIRPLGDVIYFIPAFIITKEQIDEMFAALHHSLQEIIGSDHSPL